jgi:hypothetical protein
MLRRLFCSTKKASCREHQDAMRFMYGKTDVCDKITVRNPGGTKDLFYVHISSVRVYVGECANNIDGVVPLALGRLTRVDRGICIMWETPLGGECRLEITRGMLTTPQSINVTAVLPNSEGFSRQANTWDDIDILKGDLWKNIPLTATTVCVHA